MENQSIENKNEENQNSNKSKIFIPIAIILFALAITAVVYFTGRVDRGEDAASDLSPTPTISQTTPTPSIEPTPTATQSATQVPSDWVAYDDDGTNFTLSHPADFEIRENQDGSVAFVKLGPTQTEGTEVFDGIILTVNSGPYEQASFSDFVKENHQEAQQSPVSEVGEITEGLVNGKIVYQYEEQGLGVFTHIYIPFEENAYVHVSKLVEDPTNEGFEETADTIISTIEYQD